MDLTTYLKSSKINQIVVGSNPTLSDWQEAIIRQQWRNKSSNCKPMFHVKHTHGYSPPYSDLHNACETNSHYNANTD